MFLWHHRHPRVVVFDASLQISVPQFFALSCWSNFLSFVSVSMCGFGKNGHHLSQERHSVFEDDGAGMKMIFRGRSPTMRHVSRTHRVALDWLFARINLDPKIQIKYVDTKDQLADMLTKGNFTRGEWRPSSTFVQYQHFLSLPAASNNVEMDTRRNRRRKNYGIRQGRR